MLSDWHKKHQLYGSGKSRSDAWWKSLGQSLRFKHYFVEQKFTKFASTISLSSIAQQWMKLPSSASLILPLTAGLTDPMPNLSSSLLIAKSSSISVDKFVLLLIRDVFVENLAVIALIYGLNVATMI